MLFFICWGRKSAGQTQKLHFLFFAGNFCVNETICKHFGYGKSSQPCLPEAREIQPVRVQRVTAVRPTRCDEILNSWSNFEARYSFSQTHASHVSFSASMQPVSFASGQTDGARDSCDQTTYCFIDHEYHPGMIQYAAESPKHMLQHFLPLPYWQIKSSLSVQLKYPSV